MESPGILQKRRGFCLPLYQPAGPGYHRCSDPCQKSPQRSDSVSSDEKRQILRTYLALVDGLLPDSGTINAPIARMEGSVITREVNFGTGESAITHYERLAAGKEYSLAELHLETGRTHQIRVHMKYIGHPLPGDYLYNPDYRRINRQPLHSYQLEFTHPITGKVMLFTAPLPIDFISAFYSNSLK